MMNDASGGLGGSWTHSFEEDSGGVQIYRPTHSFAFPPSRRGRETLEFGAGRMLSGTLGPDDRSQPVGASLTALGMNRYRVDAAAGVPGQVIEVVEAGPDVLKLRFA